MIILPEDKLKRRQNGCFQPKRGTERGPFILHFLQELPRDISARKVARPQTAPAGNIWPHAGCLNPGRMPFLWGCASIGISDHL